MLSLFVSELIKDNQDAIITMQSAFQYPTVHTFFMAEGHNLYHFNIVFILTTLKKNFGIGISTLCLNPLVKGLKKLNSARKNGNTE